MRQEERFLNIAVLMGAFFVLLFLGVPIAYSLCLSAVLYMALFMDVPMIIIGQQMLKGVDSFTLMAIPFFVIAGGLMESGVFKTNCELCQNSSRSFAGRSCYCYGGGEHDFCSYDRSRGQRLPRQWEES